MQRAAAAVSPAVAELMDGPIVIGRCRGHGMIQVNGYVIVVGRPGQWMLPNAIQVDLDLELEAGRTVAVGDGMIFAGRHSALKGQVWDPVPPELRNELWTDNPLVPEAAELAGTGPGLWPTGDQVVAGYAAGLTLLRDDRPAAEAFVADAWEAMGPLSRTLARHAAAGELPEQAHVLLATGDASPLLRPDRFVDRALMVGLALAGRRPADRQHATAYLHTDLRVLLQSEPVAAEPEPAPVAAVPAPAADDLAAERRRRVQSPPTTSP